MELIWIPLIGGYVYSIYVCFRKGKIGFAWTGIAGLFPLFTVFLAWFPIVGALRPAKPGSPWVLERRPGSADGTPVTAPPPLAPEPDDISDPSGAPKPEQIHGATAAPLRPDELLGFLDRALAAGVIPRDVRNRLLDFYREAPPPAAAPVREGPADSAADLLSQAPPPIVPRQEQPAPVSRPAVPVPAPARVDVPPAAVPSPAPSVAPGTEGGSVPSPLEQRVTRLRERASELWEAASSDIALHGLAYLGVLLTFVGVLGFLLFAFQDLPDSVQPAVELFIAFVFFGWAWALRRQEASTVANALELIGGMTLPLVLFAGFVDDAPIPPDATGGLLVAVMTLTSLGLAAAFAAVGRRRPESMLRFLVAPMVWLGALALGFVFKTDEPLQGIAITHLVSAQPALAAVAIAAVLTFARWGGALREFERSAMFAGFVGVPATYALTLGLATAEGWSHPLSGVFAGLATIVSVHAIAGFFDRTRFAVLATPVLLAGAIAPLIEVTGMAWAGVVAAVAYLAALEWIGRDEDADPVVAIMAAAGAAIGLAMSLGTAPAALVGFAAASLWAHRRRVTGIPIEGAADIITAAAATLPIGVGWALWHLLGHHPGLLLMAAILLAVALGARRLAGEDIFWSLWPPALAVVVGAVSVDRSVFTSIAPVGADPLIIFTLALVAATILLGREWLGLRVWAATVIGVVALLPYTGLAWAGTIATVASVAVLEWIGRDEDPDAIVWGAGALGGAAGLALSLFAAPAALAGFAAASLWAHRRRVTGIPIDGAADAMTAAAAILPIGVGWAMWDLMAHYPAVLLMAALVLAIAAAARLLDTGDMFWSLWPPALALVLGGLAIDNVFRSASGEGPESLAPITLLLVAATIGLGRQWPELRLWLASGSVAAAVALGLEGAAASPEVRSLVWATAGLAAVMVAGVSQKSLADHLAAVGHLTITGALLIDVSGEAFAVVMWAWSLGWLLSLIADSGGRASLTRLMESAVGIDLTPPGDGESSGNAAARAALQWIVPVLFASSLPIAALATANLWPDFVDNRSWTGVALALLAVGYASATRWLRSGEPLRRVVSISAAALAVMGVAIAAPVAWPTILATGSTVVVALALAADDRQVAFTWFAWVMSGVMAVLLAERAGVAPRFLYLVSLSWGVALLLGGLLADDVVSGRRPRGAGLRAGWARYPVFIGALAVPVSLAPVFSLDAAILGWSALAAAAGYFVVAILMRAGLPTAPGYALAAVGAVSLSPWSIGDDPALLPVVAAVLVGVAIGARRFQPDAVAGDVWLSWEMAPLAVAHIVGVVALAVAHATPAPELTWLLLGLVSLATAAWRRGGWWLDASIVMFIVAAGYVGLGALALALAALSVRGLIGVYFSDGNLRTMFQVIAVGAAAASWGIVLVWQDWDIARVVSNSAILFGVGSLAVAVTSRRHLVKRDSTIAWGSLAAGGIVSVGFVGGAAQVAFATGSGEPGVVGLGLAIGLAAFAVALELAAKPFEAFLRYWAVVMTGASWLAGLVGAAVSADAGIVLTAVIGGALALAVVELAWRSAAEPTASGPPANLTISQAWALLGAMSVFAAFLTAIGTGADKSTWQYGIAGGLALLAIAAARGAGPLGAAGLREASGLVGLGAVASFLYGSGAGTTGFVIVMLIVAAAASVAILQVVGKEAESIWLPPLQIVAVVANLTATGFAVSTIPDRPLIATVLLAVGIQSVAVGIGLNRPALLAAGPPAIAVAFVLTVAEAVSGSVQWYTTPLAIVILSEVEIIRLRRRADSHLISTQQLFTLEWFGIALLAVPAVVEMFFRGPRAGLLLFPVAALLLLWAIVTRIRRRAVAAAAVATGSAVMMVSSALTLGAPDSAGFWITAVGLGFAVMSVAGIIEASRSRQGRFVQRFDQLMDGWA